MNNLISRFYQDFRNVAQKSDICYQLAAGVLHDKRLVTKPCCNVTRNFCRGNFCESVHAEANALLNYYGKNLQYDHAKNKWLLTKNKPKKIDILVMRFTRRGIIGNARPCHNCLKMMKDLNVNKVYYSTGINYDIICENVKYMVSIQSSTININNMNKEHFFENLIKKLFPKYIKQTNLEYFLKYNLINVLPKCNCIIKNNNIIFYNNDVLLVTAEII